MNRTGALALLGAVVAWGVVLSVVISRRDPAGRADAQAFEAAVVKAGHPVTTRSTSTFGLDGTPIRVEVLPAEVTEKGAHVHARVKAGESDLDFCLTGPTAGDGGSAVDNAALQFAQAALPAVLAEYQPSVDAVRPFGGDAPWGVPGVRGFVGAVRPAGDVTVTDEAFFSGSPRPDTDGRLHVVKSVVACVDARPCTRKLEFDGAPTETETPLAESVAHGNGFASRFAVFRHPDRRGDASRAASALADVKSQPPWLESTRLCLAEAMPARFGAAEFDPHGCEGGRLHDCLVECQRGVAASCYSAALSLQHTEGVGADVVRALFMRACVNGSASGCTNAAASPLETDGACAQHTFELVCSRAQDPWACVMYGSALLSGPDPDLAAAKRALSVGCRLGDDDPACSQAKRLLQGL